MTKTLIQRYEYFAGVDLTNPAWTVDPHRSPDGTNMIRDVPGRVRKRMGYEIMQYFDGPVNGIYGFGGYMLVHSFCSLFKWREGEVPVRLTTQMNDAFSCGMAFGDRFLILDGAKLWVWDGSSLAAAETGATVPTVTIATPPSGGGTVYQAVNMLTPLRKQAFYGTAADTVYTLSAKNLDPTPVTVSLLQSDGTWVNHSEGQGFSVDRTDGTVTFDSAPGESPVTGEDNVVISYGKTTAGYADRINRCRFMIAYGAFGNSDRVFVSGNPDYPANDFYSEINNPLYFPDLGYLQTGSADAPITGYSVIGSFLGTHKAGEPYNRNLYLRCGENDENGEPVFRVSDVVQGPGALSHRTFAMGTEPLFLTAEGVCSATPYEYGSERYIQNRSYYLNGRLLSADLSGAVAVMFRGLYILYADEYIYVLDTAQRSSDGNDIRTAGRYEGYLWRGPMATVLAVIDDRLWFGNEDGELCRFFDDPYSARSYSDDGYPIAAKWNISFTGNHAFRRKFLRRVGIGGAPSGEYEVHVKTHGIWHQAGVSPAAPPSADPSAFGVSPHTDGVDYAVISIRSGGVNRPFYLSRASIEFYEGEPVR